MVQCNGWYDQFIFWCVLSKKKKKISVDCFPRLLKGTTVALQYQGKQEKEWDQSVE